MNDLLPFVRETSRVLVHGCGSVLALAIASAITNCRGVRFFVTEGRPQGSGELLLCEVEKTWRSANNNPFDISASCTLIPDAAVASVLGDVDFILVGANAVTEHGGLCHTTGTLQIALVAEAMHCPLYVLCETFKFTQIFPLTSKDLRPIVPQTKGAPRLCPYYP